MISHGNNRILLYDLTAGVIIKKQSPLDLITHTRLTVHSK